MWNVLFRLPSASHKRACLSSLLTSLSHGRTVIWSNWDCQPYQPASQSVSQSVTQSIWPNDLLLSEGTWIHVGSHFFLAPWSVISLFLQGPPGTMGMMGGDGERGPRVRESYSGIVCLTCHLVNPVAWWIFVKYIWIVVLGFQRISRTKRRAWYKGRNGRGQFLFYIIKWSCFVLFLFYCLVLVSFR